MMVEFRASGSWGSEFRASTLQTLSCVGRSGTGTGLVPRPPRALPAVPELPGAVTPPIRQIISDVREPEGSPARGRIQSLRAPCNKHTIEPDGLQRSPSGRRLHTLPESQASPSLALAAGPEDTPQESEKAQSEHRASE